MATNYDDSKEISGTIIDTVLDEVDRRVAKDVKFKHKIRHLTSIEVFICLTRISNKCFKSEIRRVDLTSETPSG